MGCRSSSTHHLISISDCSLFVLSFLLLPWLSAFILPPECVFSPFPLCADGFLINSLFPLFLSPLIPSLRFSSSYPPTSFPFFFTSPPLFTFSLQRGHSMNNSKALQDDNGKLEVRLCVACVCVCVRLVDSFQPGGNCKGLFIHMNYVNKVTLPFKVAKWGGVTADVVVSGRWSNDYRSVVMSTFSPTAISAISQSCFLGKLSKKEKRRRRQCLYRLKGCCNSLRAFDGLLYVLQCAHHNMPFVLCDAKFIHNGDFRNVSPFHDPWSSLLWMEK